MTWTKRSGDDLLAEQMAIKLTLGSLIDRMLEGRSDREAALAELCDFALRSCDAIDWRDVDAERAEMLREMTRERLTAFFGSLSSPLADPKARPKS